MIGLTQTIRFHDFAAIAESLGVTTTHHDEGPPGIYRHRQSLISTRRGLDVAMYRSTFAHELGHASYGDSPAFGTYTRRQERRADRFALRLLFTEEHFRDAYVWHGPHIPALADELECSQHHIRVYMALKRKR